MFFPISDHPNQGGVPVVTLALIVANCAVYLLVTLPLSVRPVDPADPLLREYLAAIAPALPPGASVRDVLRQLSAYDLFVFQHGFRPAAMSAIDLFASMFLHAGLVHLAGNMLFLWVYGDNVEHRLGAGPFLFWYLATGVAAAAFQTVFNPGSPIPMIGASGAISGVLGFYLVWFPHHTVRVFVFLFPFYVGTIFLSAGFLLWMYLIVDNVLPFFLARSPGGVAHGAHIGGFLAGVAVAWIRRRPRGP